MYTRGIILCNSFSISLSSFLANCVLKYSGTFQLLLEPSAKVSPGYCYTARGSELAVHVIVDQKHRVYACITTEDVPFSVGLSLLEEVRLISTRTDLVFTLLGACALQLKRI